MLIGGIVSKTSGGSFERGAVTVGVVFLYNDAYSTIVNQGAKFITKKELNQTNKPMRNIIASEVGNGAGMAYALDRGVIVGEEGAIGGPVGASAGFIIGFGFGLVQGSAFESFGVNNYIEKTLNHTKKSLKNTYEYIKCGYSGCQNDTDFLDFIICGSGGCNK